MRKIVITLMLCLLSATMYAQTRYIYAVLVLLDRTPAALCTEKSVSGSGTWNGFNFKENYLRDEEGCELKFNNFLSALGYVQSIGWEVLDMEVQMMENKVDLVSGKGTSFLLRKEVSEAEWLQWIDNGKTVGKKKN